MTITRIFACIAAGTLLASCASKLDKSRADRILRLEGSYTCGPVSKERTRGETPAQADASRVRCAQDSWAVFGSEVRYTRSLYQSRGCRTPLGKIEFRATAERLPSGVAVQGPVCQQVRTNIGWLGERAGKCWLKDQKLNRPYPLHPDCHAYVPEICSDADARIELIAAEAEMIDDRHEPVSELTYLDRKTNTKVVCKRYAAE